MFEYDSANKEIVHKTFIDADYVLGVLGKLIKTEDKQNLTDDDIDDLMIHVAGELDWQEDACDFDTDDYIDEAVKEWAVERGLVDEDELDEDEEDELEEA